MPSRSGIIRLSALLVAAASAQFGHLVAYQLRYGVAASEIQSRGSHAYFGDTVHAAAALLGGGLVASLLILGAARLIVARGRGLPVRAGWQPLDTIALLFTAQLATFACQETIEAVATGSQVLSGLDMLLWGAIGQMPAACLAGLALSWLSRRIEGAVAELWSSLQVRGSPSPAPVRLVPGSLPPPAYGSRLLEVAALSVFAKRGPPQLLS